MTDPTIFSILDSGRTLTWLFLPVAIALHNLEEILWLPQWVLDHPEAPRFNVETGQFRFAASGLTLVVFLISGWAKNGGPGSVGHYLLAAYGLVQVLNIIFPHAVTSWMTKSYMPGLATGLLLVIPACSVFAYLSLYQGYLMVGPLLVASLILAPLLLLALPLLFKLGSMLIPD